MRQANSSPRSATPAHRRGPSPRLSAFARPRCTTTSRPKTTSCAPAQPDGYADTGVHTEPGAQPAMSASRAPARAGDVRRPPTSRRAVESWRPVPPARIARSPTLAVLVGPRAAATALPALSKAVTTDTGVHVAAADLPFRLVESLVNMWTKQPTREDLALPEHVADACIRVLGVARQRHPRATRPQSSRTGAVPGTGELLVGFGHRDALARGELRILLRRQADRDHRPVEERVGQVGQGHGPAIDEPGYRVEVIGAGDELRGDSRTTDVQRVGDGVPGPRSTTNPMLRCL